MAVSLPVPAPVQDDVQLFLNFQYGGTLPWDYLIRASEGLEHTGVPSPLPTHAYFTFKRGGYTSIIEAVTPTVQRVDNPRPRQCRSYSLAGGKDAMTVWQYAESKIGVPYDLPGILVAFGYCTLREQDRWYQRHHEWLFCSELCVDAIRTIRLCLPGRDSDTISPADLEAWAWNTLT